ncbi:Hypothetical protein SMAX5B_000353 [Scophthalmus maximus]|uniref:Uncharacterized protein n=1 Tax=Scophthalmus maximus TaxID=52904 RepID=A0A2U9CJ31_SCOMX|nr:Hypothetical protein SMAX5B_000353 [Scophthalmus maximus]
MPLTLAGNVTASGGAPACVCSAFLPDSSFPADRVHHMQQVTTDLRLELEIQMNKNLMHTPPSPALLLRTGAPSPSSVGWPSLGAGMTLLCALVRALLHLVLSTKDPAEYGF